MNTEDLDKLPAKVLAFCKKYGMSKTAFGIAINGDPNFVPELVKGRSPTLRTAKKILSYIGATDAKHEKKRRRPRSNPRNLLD